MSYLLSGFGLKIPTDVSIIGFNNSIFAEKFRPELTSIDLHTDSLTSQTVYQFDRVDGRKTNASSQNHFATSNHERHPV